MQTTDHTPPTDTPADALNEPESDDPDLDDMLAIVETLDRLLTVLDAPTQPPPPPPVDLFAELLAEVTAKPPAPPPPAFRSEWQTTANIYQWFTHICPACSREHSVLQGTMIRQKSLKLLDSYRMIKGMHDPALPWEHTHVTNNTGQCKDCWEERGMV